MNRRDFLKKIPVAGATAIVGGSTIQAYANSPMVQAMTAGLFETDRVLVIIQLSGGNDGLNMVIPIDQYANLKTLRSNILMDENKILKLNDKTGIHPAMARFHEMFKDGKLAAIQSVGYPNFNFSHFRATDIWMTGSDSNKNVDSGWTSRYLNYEYPNFPVGYPNAKMPDPLAVKMGGAGTVATQFGGINMGFSVNTNPAATLDLNGYPFTDTTTADFSGKELSFVREMMRQTDKFEDVVKAAYDKGKNISTLYPSATGAPGLNLAAQLKTVARCISGGLKTRIYFLNTGGFDTHSGQTDIIDKSTGVHANLLKGVADAVYGFMDDIKLLGLEERVMGFTFSEFGRRIVSNTASGTDHGAAAPMFVFGKAVKGGVVGNNITVPTGANVNSNIPMQYDFRSVYASILGDWFCVPQNDLDTILLKNFQKLKLVDPTGCLPVDVHEANNAAGENMLMPYPNPFQESTNVKYETKGGHTNVSVFNNEGQILRVLVDDIKDEGRYEVRCDLGDLPAGVYYVRLQNGELQQVKPMIKVR
jgi:uncharacterized protein (DUF1501 family)